MYVRRKVFSILQDENGEERLFSVNETELTQKEFSNKEQKRLRREYDASLGKDEITPKDIELVKRLYGSKNPEVDAAIRKTRIKRRLEPIFDADRTLEDKQKMSKADLERFRQRNLESYKNGVAIGKIGVDLELNPIVDKDGKNRQKVLNTKYIASDRANPNAGELGQIKGRNIAIKKIREEEAQKAEKERLAMEAAARKAESKASFEKHKSQAEKLRKDHKVEVALRDTGRWIKNNPGKSIAVGLGTAGAVAGGIALHKHHKKKKSEEKED